MAVVTMVVVVPDSRQPGRWPWGRREEEEARWQSSPPLGQDHVLTPVTVITSFHIKTMGEQNYLIAFIVFTRASLSMNKYGKIFEVRVFLVKSLTNYGQSYIAVQAFEQMIPLLTPIFLFILKLMNTKFLFIEEEQQLFCQDIFIQFNNWSYCSLCSLCNGCLADVNPYDERLFTYLLTFQHIKDFDFGIATNICFRSLIFPLQNFFKTLETITELQNLHANTFLFLKNLQMWILPI